MSLPSFFFSLYDTSFSFISCHFFSFSFSFSTSLQSLFLLPSVSTLYSFSLHFSHVFLCSFLPLDFPWLTLLHFFNVIFFQSLFHDEFTFIHCFIFDSSMHSCTYHFISSMFSFTFCFFPLSLFYWYYNCYSYPFIHCFSHPFHKFSSTSCSSHCALSIAIFSSTSYHVLAPLPHHFPTPSTYHFLFFYATFLVFNLIFISFAYCFSHPFDVYLNNVLFTLQSSIVCDIQFHFLTRYNMTSPFYSNSFNIIFFIFFSPFPLCIDLVFFLLFDCFGIRFVILLFNWECWYIFCYFVIQLGVLVYLLLFYLCGGCVGISFVI